MNDFELEQQSLLHKRRLAEAMMGGGLAPMGPTEVVGGYAVKKSPLEGLAKVLQAYFGAKQVQSVSDEEKALSTRFRQEGKTGVERFLSTMYGDSAAIPGGEGTDAYGGQIDYKADPRRAIMEAMTSSHPGVQQLGLAHMKQMGKGSLDLAKLAEMATPESVLKSPNDPSKWVPKRDLKSVAAGGVLLDEAGNVAQPGMGAGTPPQAPGGKTTGLPSGPGWETLKIGDDLYQMSATGLKKLDNAAKVNVSPTITLTNAGAKAGMEAWAKEAAKTVSELSDSARQSVKLMTQLNQLEALTKGGTNAGPLADAQTFIQGLANQAGMKVDKGQLSNSQAFNSVATQAWAALMQQNGGARGLVKEESEKLAQSLPSLAQTPQGRAQIIAVLRQQAAINVEDAKRANQEFGKALRAENPELFTYGLSATTEPQSPPQLPAAGSVAPGQPIPLEEYLKQRGVR